MRGGSAGDSISADSSTRNVECHAHHSDGAVAAFVDDDDGGGGGVMARSAGPEPTRDNDVAAGCGLPRLTPLPRHVSTPIGGREESKAAVAAAPESGSDVTLGAQSVAAAAAKHATGRRGRGHCSSGMADSRRNAPGELSRARAPMAHPPHPAGVGDGDRDGRMEVVDDEREVGCDSHDDEHIDPVAAATVAVAAAEVLDAGTVAPTTFPGVRSRPPLSTMDGRGARRADGRVARLTAEPSREPR